MDRKQHSTYTASTSNSKDEKTTVKSTRARGDCSSKTSSHTQYMRKDRHEENKYDRITRDEYLGMSESLSGSSDTFRCVHGLEGKQYTSRGLLKRNIVKELEPVKKDPIWTETCPTAYGWGIAKKLEFLITDPMGVLQTERLDEHIKDLTSISASGYKINVLDSLCVIVDYLVENVTKKPALEPGLRGLLTNMTRPILLDAESDVITYYDVLQAYLGYLGYLLIRLDRDEHFDIVSRSLTWQLSAPDSARGAGAVRLRHVQAAAPAVLHQIIVRMIAIATPHRFHTFVQAALLLACESLDNCLLMMNENILENIFYRYNPYFPERKLPPYDLGPENPQDSCVKLGASSVHMSTILSLLLVLLKTTKQYIDEDPKRRLLLPCPDDYAQRCFIWAYRYECRAREHRHERTTLTVVTLVLLDCFKDRLRTISTLMMPDVISMSVLTEVRDNQSWIKTVPFNTGQDDVLFKKTLIYLSVDLLKVFGKNFLVECRYWLLGLIYLLDPGLSSIRARWSPPLFAEIRKTALQALVCTLPLMPPKVVKEYALIRRILWYIEWYTDNPYELPVLYWCLRVLQACTFHRYHPARPAAIQDLFDTHGIIILMQLCYTLMRQKQPPVEKSQCIIALSLRMLTSAVEANARLTCCVYPELRWPAAVNSLSKAMLDSIIISLNKHYIISDRWLISMLNFIWETVIWKKEYRSFFIAHNGVYKLLDLITMTHPSVQCLALALLCDVVRAGDAVGELVTWRASMGAANATSVVVKRGSTISSLIAAIFRDECEASGVKLDSNGVIQDLDYPLMSQAARNTLISPSFKPGGHQKNPMSLSAAELAGSRLSKVFALLHMLSDDLHYKVSLADEAYNLYKNVPLNRADEVTLVLCSHFLSAKLHEAWVEAQHQLPGLLPQDYDTLDEFLQMGRGWAKEIKQQQNDVIDSKKKKDLEEERSLHAFLARARLTTALDALRDVRCVARSASRTRLAHALLHDAVAAHRRRAELAPRLSGPILKTYRPPLDEQNMTGQNVKVYSIRNKLMQDEVSPLEESI